MADPYSLVVIGAGPGGYVSAIRAAQLGMKTAIVENENLGGICLNWGCIPTKALLRSAEVYRQMQHAADYGLSCSKPDFDLDALVARSRQVAQRLNSGVGHLLKKNKVSVSHGWAKLDGKSGKNWKVTVQNAEGKTRVLLGEKVLIASGARARQLPDMACDGARIWSYRDALMPKFFPQRLLVIGSGAIGIEFASFFATFGAKVMVLEALERIVPAEDEEISALAQKSFIQQGMTIHTSAKLESMKASRNSVCATFTLKGKTQQQEFDAVIVAIGIVGNVENLGLENTRLIVEHGHISTDALGATAESGLYAIGDVTGPPWLAHKAEHEGTLCVEHIAGLDVEPLDKGNIPGCTYCHPQLASVGLSEAKAQAAGFIIKVGRVPFLANGKALALGETEGMIKTIFDAKSGALLGVHMIGAEVTELIHGFTLARTLETTENELIHTVFPHPTLSEMLHESSLAAFERAIHI